MTTTDKTNLFDQVDFAAEEQTHSNNSSHSCIHSFIVITSNNN